jgi:parallel beta-helix repeat protein
MKPVQSHSGIIGASRTLYFNSGIKPKVKDQTGFSKIVFSLLTIIFLFALLPGCGGGKDTVAADPVLPDAANVTEEVTEEEIEKVDAPSAPLIVTATPGDSIVTVEWEAVDGAVSYNLYWGTTADLTVSGRTKIETISGTSYLHEGLFNDLTYYYVATSVNEGGESELSSEVSATPIKDAVDITAPTTTAYPPGSAFSSALSVFLFVNDTATTYYTTDGTEPTPSSSVYSSPIDITVDTTLKFFSVDSAGNVEDVKTETYTYDISAPVTTADPAGGEYGQAQAVTLTVNEAATTYYTIDGADPDTGSTLYSMPIDIATDTTMKFFSVDEAGNTEVVSTEIYTVDTSTPTAPEVYSYDLSKDPNPYWYWWSSALNGSGLFRYKLDDSDFSSGATETDLEDITWPDAFADGETHTLYVQEQGINGNWSSAGSAPVVIDLTAPTITLKTPADGSAGVTTDSAISVVFSEKVLAYTVNATSFTVTGSSSVAGTIALSGNNTVATFTPSSQLEPGTTYTVTVTTYVRDVAFNSMPSTVTWSFSTVAISSLYSNGKDWNSYVENDGATIFSATDTQCDINGPNHTGYDSCLHGGEMRIVSVPGYSSCTGLTAVDALGAFDWSCDGSTNPVRMVSTGLKDSMNLSDLLDFTDVAWRDNLVTVSDVGTPVLTTDPGVWWSNPVIEINADGTQYLNPGSVYVVTADVTASLDMGATAALVIKPGNVLIGSGTGKAIDVGAMSWVEGTVDALREDNGIELRSKFSVLKNVHVSKAAGGSSNSGISLYSAENCYLHKVVSENNLNRGIFLYGASNNTFSEITAFRNNYGIYLFASSDNNRFTGIDSFSNTASGIFSQISASNRFSDVRANNNGASGIAAGDFDRYSNVIVSNNFGSGFSDGFGAQNLVVTGLTASNNGRSGFSVSSSSIVVSNATLTNNGSFSGVSINGSASGAVLSNIATVNNDSYGIHLSTSSRSTVENIAATDNPFYGVKLSSSDSNRFTGLLKTGGNGFGDCSVDVSVNPGLIDATCANEGASDATLVTSVTSASSFAGKVTVNDTVNSEVQTGGTAPYVGLTDWSNFENRYRSWGKDGSAFPNADNAGQCISATCRIWDWALSASDTVLRNVLGVRLNGNAVSTIEHSWPGYAIDQIDCDNMVTDSIWFGTDDCRSTFLRDASEVLMDDIGNDNGLCESNETCLYTPNIGSYQGHGSLVSAGTFTDGDTLAGITLMKYSINGY